MPACAAVPPHPAPHTCMTDSICDTEFYRLAQHGACWRGLAHVSAVCSMSGACIQACSACGRLLMGRCIQGQHHQTWLPAPQRPARRRSGGNPVRHLARPPRSAPRTPPQAARPARSARPCWSGARPWWCRRARACTRCSRSSCARRACGGPCTWATRRATAGPARDGITAPSAARRRTGARARSVLTRAAAPAVTTALW